MAAVALKPVVFGPRPKSGVNSKTYRLGFDRPMNLGFMPSFLSVHTLRCIYGRHEPVVCRRLGAAGLQHPLETDVIWGATGRRIKDPTNPLDDWIMLTPLDMPDNFREHNIEFRREQPIYTIYPDNTITVSQYNIIRGDFPASWQDMQACDDRIEKLLDGTIRFVGLLRSKPSHPSREQRVPRVYIFLFSREKAPDPGRTLVPELGLVKGLRSRIDEYYKDNPKNLALHVRKSLEERFEITYIGATFSILLPYDGDIPYFRAIVRAVEASFTCMFWAIWSVQEGYIYVMEYCMVCRKVL